MGSRQSIAVIVFACAIPGIGCYGGASGGDGGASATDTDAGTGGTGGTGATDPNTTEGPDESGDDGVPEDLDPESVNEPIAARLTDAQYRNTILDVLGETLTPEELDLLPRDVPIEGSYATAAQAQGFSSQYVLGYAYIARTVSQRLSTADLLSTYGECDAPVASCIGSLASGLGLRLFRRPLTDDEVAVYIDLAAAIEADPNTDDDAIVRGVVQALLQAPQFLYRLEHETDGTPGEARRIDGYELASRLSFFLWMSAPDPELLAFAGGPAGDGDYDGSQVDQQIERMVADPKFARARTAFWGDYSLASTSAFGANDPALAGELRDSLLATLERISGVDAQPRPLTAVFDGDEYVMTPAVAEIAGAESLGEGLQVYPTSSAQERSGAVTHPAFLAAIGTTSFVGRGVFLTERLLCQHIAAPPEGIAEQIMDTAQMTGSLTPRGASEFRFGLDPVCQVCHRQFEPIAYAFERYDIEGRYTLTDDEGRDLFSDGVLPPFGDRPEISFSTAAELLSPLGASTPVYDCFVENMAEFGTGLPANWDGEFLSLASEGFQDDGLTFDALVRAVASGDQMTYSRIVAAQ